MWSPFINLELKSNAQSKVKLKCNTRVVEHIVHGQDMTWRASIYSSSSYLWLLDSHQAITRNWVTRPAAEFSSSHGRHWWSWLVGMAASAFVTDLLPPDSICCHHSHHWPWWLPPSSTVQIWPGAPGTFDTLGLFYAWFHISHSILGSRSLPHVMFSCAALTVHLGVQEQLA